MAQYRLDRPWAAGPWGAPLGDLRRDMEALFDRFSTGSPQASGWQGVFPPVNLYETPDTYVLLAELPGLEADDLHISLEGSTVTIEGERKIDYTTREGISLHRRERQSGSFRRAVQLPAAIDADNVEAVHRNGVLRLRLPKRPEHQPRQIAVQAS